MTDVLGLIEAGLFAKLSANANLTALVSTRIYEGAAPASTPVPFVRFAFISGGDDNEAPRRGEDIVMQVECFAATRAEARNGAGYIDEALLASELTITGWSNWRTLAEGRVVLTEEFEGQQVYRRGARYRISADKNSS